MKFHNISVCLILAGFLGGASTLLAQDASPALDWLERDSLVVDQFSQMPAWSRSSAVSVVKGSKLEKSFTQNLMNTLYGELAGLTVMKGSGEPGSDSPSINARGYNTFSNTDRSVLVIVDGYESTFDNLSVYEIESIQLLKDAAAAAMFGMRAANGVLLITTKRGADKPLEVNFSAQTGLNFAAVRPEFLDAYNYALLYNEARVNDGLTPLYNDDALTAYKDGSDPYLFPNSNWQKEVLKDYSVQQNYNLNFRGGNRTVQYFAMLGVSDNNGFFKGTDPSSKLSSNSKFTRYNIRGNVDVNITSNISAHLTLAANLNEKFSPAGGASGVYNKLYRVPPTDFPVTNPNGTYGGSATFSNPLGDLLETGLNSSNSRNIQSVLKVDYDFDKALKGLKFSVAFSFNNYFTGSSNKSKKYQYYALAWDGVDYIYNPYNEKTTMTIDDSGSAQWRNMSFSANADYQRSFGKVDFGTYNQFFSDVNYKLANSSLKDSEFPYRYIGVRGRTSLAFDKKYLAEFTYSYMGANLYAPGKQYGFFPAASLGWIASNEDFLKDNSFITYLKLRGSYGLVGHNSIVGSKRFAYTQDYKYSDGYYLGVDAITKVNGQMEDSVADVNRTWEKERRLNVGADMTLAGKLDLSFDYFVHKRSDILVPGANAVPSVLGMSYSYINMGRTTNTGFELGVRYADKIGNDLEYYVDGKAWFAKNRIDFQAEEVKLYPNLISTGHIIGQSFGLLADGLLTQEDLDNGYTASFYDGIKPGDIKYVDVNGDETIDNQDVTAIGTTGNPQLSGSITLGLRYKGVDVEAMFYGAGIRDVYLSGNTYWAFMNEYSAPVSALGRWTPETAATAEYPRLSSKANPNNTQYSSFWLKDGSFIKLKYLEAGYTFPVSFGANNNFRMRAFINGTNLFTLHNLGKYKNADPEGMGGFPAMRTVSLGLKFKF